LSRLRAAEPFAMYRRQPYGKYNATTMKARRFSHAFHCVARQYGHQTDAPPRQPATAAGVAFIAILFSLPPPATAATAFVSVGPRSSAGVGHAVTSAALRHAPTGNHLEGHARRSAHGARRRRNGSEAGGGSTPTRAQARAYPYHQRRQYVAGTHKGAAYGTAPPTKGNALRSSQHRASRAARG